MRGAPRRAVRGARAGWLRVLSRSAEEGMFQSREPLLLHCLYLPIHSGSRVEVVCADLGRQARASGAVCAWDADVQSRNVKATAKRAR